MHRSPSTSTPGARVLSAGLIALGVSFVLVPIAPYLPFFRVAENWTEDVRVALLSTSRPINQEIIVVRVTEETLATLTYRSPIDRGFLADLLNTLDAKGARLIGLDVLLDRGANVKSGVQRLNQAAT